MRIAFFGLPLAAVCLAADGHTIELAVLAPVEAPGRRRLSHVATRVLDADDPEIDDAVDALEVDLVVSWYWTRLLPEAWLGKGRLGAIGVHPSLLPRHRGPNPFFAAIDAGDDETGITVHRLTQRYDEGDILFQERIAVGARDSWQLARALDRPSLRGLRRAVADLERGAAEERAQDERQATWAPEPSGEQLRADFGWTTERVLRRVRALSPVPGLALEVDGLCLFVTGADSTDEFPSALRPGEAAAVNGRVVIRTGSGAIAIRSASDAETDEPVDLEKLAERIASHYRPV
jgi:methionyl-tRNA formyltransferase